MSHCPGADICRTVIFLGLFPDSLSLSSYEPHRTRLISGQPDRASSTAVSDARKRVNQTTPLYVISAVKLAEVRNNRRAVTESAQGINYIRNATQKFAIDGISDV